MTTCNSWAVEAVADTWVDHVHHFPEIDSTNTYALNLALQGAPEGTLVIADSQTHGRGRLGRPWWDEPGTHLLMSFILRPSGDPSRWPRVGLAAALALTHTLTPLTAHPIQIKWPNDVLIGNKKVAGILLEGALQSVPPALILGMGVNLTADRLPEELQLKATALSSFTTSLPDRKSILRNLVLALGQTIPLIHRPALLLEHVSARLIGIGQNVTLHTPWGSHEGVFHAIAEDGRLLLKTDTGLQSYYAGDVSFSPL